MEDPDYWERMTAWINRPPSKAEIQEREREQRRHAEGMAKGRRRIAELARPYPLYVCVQCHHVTGWLGNWRSQMLEGGDADSCFDCLRHGLYGHGVDWEPIYEPILYHGWLPDSKDQARILRSLRELSGPKPPLWVRLARLAGWARPYELRVLPEWRRGVEGWLEQPPLDMPMQVRLPEKTEVAAPDGSGRLVVFRVGWYDWQGGRWRRRKRGPHSALPPEAVDVFPASLPMEQLVAAWDDFQALVAQENEEDWRRREHYRRLDQERAALDAQKAQDREDRDKQERGVAELF